MGALSVEDHRCLATGREEFQVQALVPQPSIKALPEGILPGTTGVDVAWLRSPLRETPLYRPGDELRPVVRAQPLRRPMLGEYPLQDGDDPPCAERPADLDRQAFPREFVDQGQHAEGPAVRALVLQEVVRPDVAWILGADGHRVLDANPSASAAGPGDGKIQGLNLLALTHLSNLPDRARTRSHVPLSSQFVDALLLLLTAAMVIALLACAVLAWGGRIEPGYRLPGKIGVFICVAYFMWLFWLNRLAPSSEEREWR